MADTSPQAVLARLNEFTSASEVERLRAQLGGDESSWQVLEPVLWVRQTELRALELEQRQAELRQQLEAATMAIEVVPLIEASREQGWVELQRQCQTRHRRLVSEEEAADQAQREQALRHARTTANSSQPVARDPSKVGNQAGVAFGGMLRGAMTGGLIALLLAAGSCVCGSGGAGSSLMVIIGTILGGITGLVVALSRSEPD